MLDRIIKGILTILGGLLGLLLYIYIVNDFFNTFKEMNPRPYFIGIIISSFIGGALMFLLSRWLINKARGMAIRIENEIANVPVGNIFLGAVGLIVGLIIAYLISQLVNRIPYVGTVFSAIIYLFMAYIGVNIGTRKAEEILNIQSLIKKSFTKEKGVKTEHKSCPKILDTSVIIDGRIADICKTGFIEGPLIIPEFILEELRHIADSSAAIKRNRGRRGLDILNKIQKELEIEVRISDKDFEEISEVDTKLLKLAQYLDGKVLTNDYNLNKVAELQGVPVLNINELANAIKPVVLPGEEMIVQVVKDGKESGQGLAYLDDGTMIVVESGKKYIGQNIDVLVTSVLQTAAGRMIFAKPKTLVDKSA